MRRAGLLLTAALLGSCGPQQRAAAPVAPSVPPARCQVGPDDGPPLADRGIGGTGGPASLQLTDRGIGGTGGPAGLREADRGIGGTGIVGVVTGFASVCLAGHEAALDDAVPLEIDGRAAGLAALRAGQVAAIQAEGAGPLVRARRVAIRHEVSGPVTAVQPDGSLVVAGQRVAASAGTRGATAPGRGAWVDVSGLRRPDGVIEATRIDPREPGPVTVHGVLETDGVNRRIGALPVQVAAGPLLASGTAVTASGRYAEGALLDASLTPDVLADDPAAYFGPAVAALVIEAYAPIAGGRVRLGQGLYATAPGWAGGAELQRRVFDVELRRGGLPRLTTVHEVAAERRGLGEPQRGGFGPGGAGGPAPVPSRAFESAPVPNRRVGPGPGGGIGREFGDGPPGRGSIGPSGANPGRTGPISGPGFGPGGGLGPGSGHDH